MSTLHNKMIREAVDVNACFRLEMNAAFLILSLGLFTGTGSERCEFFWKTYNGVIPKDAVEGGRDSSGNLFYIALVDLKLVNEILPGMFIPNLQVARVTSYAAVQNVKNTPNTVVKILCTTYKKGFEWIKTKSEDLHLLAGLVPGGKVLGQTLFIGRVLHEGGLVLGTVFPNNFIYKGLYVPGREHYVQYFTYEVLTFNCGTFDERREYVDRDFRDSF